MKKINFNKNWEYTNIDVETNKDLGISMTVFEPVQLPHDYTVENPFDKINPSAHQGGYVRTGTLWYRKFYTVKSLGKPVFLLFEGVYSNSTVYVNGIEVGGREYGYSSFCVEITEALKLGLNLIAVKVDGTKEPSTRWFNGQGITRNVWLMEGDSVYIKNDGVYLNPLYQGQGKTLVPVEITVVAKEKWDGELNINVEFQNSKILNITEKIHLQQGENTVKTELALEETKLWSVEEPSLYSCKIEIGEDQMELNFGVRTLEFKPNEGFFLNDVHTYIKGVCMHHDGGAVGAAVPKSLWKKRILMLKDMGCNAIRTSHNPFDPSFYDLCDELGMLVMDEAFDGWDIPKVKFGYSTIWEKCHVQDVEDLIIRDRNHPCVFMWSIGNEVLDMNPEITKELMEIIRNLDNTRKITAGVQQTTETSDLNRSILDVAGYNDGGGACFIYEDDHKKRPEQLLIATEAPHSFQTRGFYRTQTWWRDKNQPRKEIENLTEEEIFFDQNINYNSSYDNSGVRTCARDSWELVEKLPYLCGEFRWTGFDYIGEAFENLWPTKTHSFGVIDTANFPKDHFYLYQSMWKEEKMLHILPHWTHRYMEEGTLIPVWVYTNLDEVELFLNGKSQGKKKKGDLKNLQWLVPYEKGEIVARGYENNQLILEKVVKTSGSPTDIKVQVEEMSEDDGTKLAQITFESVDEKGNFVPYSNNITGIYTSSTVRFLGSDNGAIDDMSPLKSKVRRAFNGLGMYLVKHESGEVEVASILGDNYFDEETKINLVVKEVWEKNSYEIYYRVNHGERKIYKGAFNIAETSVIEMEVYKEGVKIISISDIFIKGRPEPVVDLTHLNYEVDMERPAGPFASKIIGDWQCGTCKYTFQKDGTVTRTLGSVSSQMGYWWYDFPADFLETPNYAGMGEMWLISGEKIEIKLESQKGEKLQIDNTENLLGNIAGGVSQVQFIKE